MLYCDRSVGRAFLLRSDRSVRLCQERAPVGHRRRKQLRLPSQVALVPQVAAAATSVGLCPSPAPRLHTPWPVGHLSGAVPVQTHTQA